MIIEKVEWKSRPSEWFVRMDKDTALWLAQRLIEVYRDYLPNTISLSGIDGRCNFTVAEKMSDYEIKQHST